MEVKTIDVRPGDTPDRARLAARIRYADSDAGAETIFFDVPEQLAGSLSETGHPWLVLFLPLAATLGEPLRIHRPVDPMLLENCQTLLEIWRSWYPRLSNIEIDVPVSHRPVSTDGRTMAFFSGGIDSFSTLLQADDDPNEYDDFVFVWGFDIPRDNARAFRRYWHKIRKLGDELGKSFFYVATNLRETRFREADWAGLYHGAALASIGLALEKRYARILISATHRAGDVQHWGSHPDTDPLCSTSKTEVVHYGGERSRVQKTARVARSAPALDNLRVCAHSRSDENCSHCNKCYRTMINLELLGALERCTRFDRSQFSIERIASLYSDSENAMKFLYELEQLARDRGRTDIANALLRSYKHSKHLDRWLQLPRFLKRQPFLWRYSEPVERLILNRSIY